MVKLLYPCVYTYAFGLKPIFKKKIPKNLVEAKNLQKLPQWNRAETGDNSCKFFASSQIFMYFLIKKDSYLPLCLSCIMYQLLWPLNTFNLYARYLIINVFLLCSMSFASTAKGDLFNQIIFIPHPLPTLRQNSHEKLICDNRWVEKYSHQQLQTYSKTFRHIPFWGGHIGRKWVCRFNGNFLGKISLLSKFKNLSIFGNHKVLWYQNFF